MSKSIKTLTVAVAVDGLDKDSCMLLHTFMGFVGQKFPVEKKSEMVNEKKIRTIMFKIQQYTDDWCRDTETTIALVEDIAQIPRRDFLSFDCENEYKVYRDITIFILAWKYGISAQNICGSCNIPNVRMVRNILRIFKNRTTYGMIRKLESVELYEHALIMYNQGKKENLLENTEKNI